jgi:hypothetical protein
MTLWKRGKQNFGTLSNYSNGTFIGLYLIMTNGMSQDDEDEQPTKTVVIANDLHTAVKRLSDLEDDSIQDTVDSILRDDDDIQEELRIIEERRAN